MPTFSNVQLQFAVSDSDTLALSLLHSRTLWLTLTQSGSLSGSLRRSSAQRVLVWLSTLWTCGHTLYPILCGGSNFQVRNYAECGLPYMALSNVSVNQSLRLILCWIAFMAQSVYVDDTRAKFGCLAFWGFKWWCFGLMVVKSHFLDRNIAYTKGSHRQRKVQFFLTLFKRPLNICPILHGVFFKTRFCREWKFDIMYLFHPQISPSMLYKCRC